MDYGKLFARREKLFQVIHKLQKKQPLAFRRGWIVFRGEETT